jgi:hypothetical protein
MELVNNCFIGGFSNQASLFQFIHVEERKRERYQVRSVVDWIGRLVDWLMDFLGAGGIQ